MAKARGKEHDLEGAPAEDSAPIVPEDRSEHHRDAHLDPADRSHFWQHPAGEHDPYPVAPAAAAPQEGLTYPRWIHKRNDDGSVKESKVVQHAEDHAAHLAAGWPAETPPDESGGQGVPTDAPGAPPAPYPRWVHKRGDDGAIVDSQIVPHEAAHEAAKATGYR